MWFTIFPRSEWSVMWSRWRKHSLYFCFRLLWEVTALLFLFSHRPFFFRWFGAELLKLNMLFRSSWYVCMFRRASLMWATFSFSFFLTVLSRDFDRFRTDLLYKWLSLHAMLSSNYACQFFRWNDFFFSRSIVLFCFHSFVQSSAWKVYLLQTIAPTP